MKISKSKQELASIISENGGWREGEFAAQDGDGSVGGYDVKPEWNSLTKYWWREAWGEWFLVNKIKNHHQTVLSRGEYSHLYPAPDAKPRFCESVVRSIPEPDEQVWTNPPSIEQLAAEYRSKLDYANRKQDEADKANIESDAALSQLEDAIAAIGFVITPLAATEKEPELVITDWRDLLVCDRIWCCEDEELAAGEYVVLAVEEPDYDGVRAVVVEGSSDARYWIDTSKEWRFIRRP